MKEALCDASITCWYQWICRDMFDEYGWISYLKMGELRNSEESPKIVKLGMQDFPIF